MEINDQDELRLLKVNIDGLSQKELKTLSEAKDAVDIFEKLWIEYLTGISKNYYRTKIDSNAFDVREKIEKAKIVGSDNVIYSIKRWSELAEKKYMDLLKGKS